MSNLPIQQGGLRVLSGIVPASSASTYGTHYSYLGVGGYVEVPTIDDRNSIPADSNMNDEGYSTGRRRYGMMVYVIDEDKLYRLFPYSGSGVVSLETFTGTSELNQVTMLSNNNGWIEVPDLSVLITGGTYFSGSSSIVLYDSTGGTVSITGITTTDIVNPGDGRILVSTGNSESIFVAQSNMVFTGSTLSITGGTVISTTGTTLHPSAILHLDSKTKGLLFPVLTTSEKNAIANPTSGLTVYDSTLEDLSVYTSSGWTGVIAERDNLQKITERGNTTNRGLIVSGTTYIVGSGSSSSSSSLLISNSANTLTSQFTDEGKVYLAIPASGSSQYSVGIGTQSPQAILHVLYNFGQVIRNERISDNNSGPTYRLVKGRGSLTGPTAVLVNDGLGDFNWQGYHTSGSTQATSSGTYVGFAARISATSIENWSSTARGARINFEVNQSGTTTNVTVVNMLHNSVSIGNSTNSLSATLGVKGSGSTSGLTFRTVNSSNTDTFRILDSGNVLIGTTTDGGYKLDVNGTVRIQGANLDFINTSANFKLGYSTSKYTTFEAVSDGATRVSVNGVVKFFIGNSPLSGIEIPSDYSISFVNPGVLTYSHINWNVTNNQFEFKNGDKSLFAGVMVGNFTTTGTTRIISTGSTSGSTAFSVQNSTGGTLLNLFSNGNLNIDSGVLYVNGDNGRVGIGTTNLTTKLEVVGTHVSGVGIARFKGDAQLGFMGLDTETAGGESGFLISLAGTLTGQFGVNGTNNSVYIKNRIYGTSDVLTIYSTGNVAINTTTDAGYKLDVNGTFRSVNDSYFATTSGNVGIGTTSAAQKLHVAGNILSSDSQGYGFYTARYNNHLTQNAYYTGNTWYSYGSSGTYGSAILFQTAGQGGSALNILVDNSVSGPNESLSFTAIMQVKTNGNVLIGNDATDFGYKLDVSGTTRIISTGSTSGSTTLTIQNSISGITTQFRSDGVIGISSATTYTTQGTVVISATSQNSGIAIVPNGTGAFTLSIPDGTPTGGGNARGRYAVDLKLGGRTAQTQIASGDYSAVIGGDVSTASGVKSLAGGSAFATGTNSVALGGSSTASGSGSVAIGGEQGGGLGATASGRAAIAFGLANTATADFSNSLGGLSNSASGSYSSIVGGQSNTSSSSNSSILGGWLNIISGGAYGAIVGGRSNVLSTSSWYSFIGAGWNNGIINGDYSVIVGGFSNSATTQYAAVIGGGNNRSTGLYSLTHGLWNVASSSGSTAIGFYNTASGGYSVVLGSGNTSNSNHTSILGGVNNNIYAQSATIVGGSSNLTGSYLSFIGGGTGNYIANNNNTNYGYSSIVGGASNKIGDDDFPYRGSFIGGGLENKINATRSFVGSGYLNRILTSSASFIGGGELNTVNTDYSVIVGGQSNTISTNTYATIIGGLSNTASGQYSIAGGHTSVASGDWSTAFGDSNATGTGSFAVGTSTTASGSRSISMGQSTTASGSNSIALGFYASATNKSSFSVGEETYSESDYGIAFGYQSHTRLRAQQALSSGNFGSEGSAQQSLLTSRAVSATTSGSTITLSLDGTGVTNLITPYGNNRAWNVVINTITVCTVVSGGTLTVGDAHAGEYKFLFKRVGGTSTISPITTSSEVADTSMATASYSFSAGTSQQLAIVFNAPNTANNSTFRAVAKVALTEVAW